MSDPGIPTTRQRAITLAAPIAAGLVILGAAVTQHRLSANGALAQPATADLIVSSSRDAGPDTLRDAILAADRLSSHAHIVITARQIDIESALPALVNPNGVDIEAATATTLDAGRQTTGAALQVNSPNSTLRKLHFTRARVSGLIVNAPGVQLDSITVSGSKVGILLNATALDCVVRTSILEHNETGLMAQSGVRRVAVLSSIFRDNSRAGAWFVAAAAKAVATSDSAPEEAPGVRIADSVFEKNATGIVVANLPIVVQKGRFLANRESALVVLGGGARLEDSEIRDSGSTAVSVTSSSGVLLARNTLTDNPATAISVRDSAVVIERNTLTHNGLGIVSVLSRGSLSTVIADNVITATTADAVTLIGGAPLVQRNRILQNHGAGLRTLDLVQGSGGLKATPRLEANVVQGNRVDTPITGAYNLTGAP